MIYIFYEVINMFAIQHPLRRTLVLQQFYSTFTGFVLSLTPFSFTASME
jgi:hypothetical protein